MRELWIGVALLASLTASGTASAVDMTGAWYVEVQPDLFATGPEIWHFSQSGAALDLLPRNISGTIGSGGGFFFDLGVPSPPCPIATDLSGTAAADGRTFSAYESVVRPACMGTVVLFHYSGVRCLNEPGTPEDCETPFDLLSSRKLIVRDRDAHPESRRIAFLSLDAAITPPAPSSGSDPRLGAVLVVARGADEIAAIELPGSLWKGLGNPAGSSGYRFRDPSPGAICRRATLRAGRLSISCRGAGIPFTLNESSQGGLSLTLSMGGTRFCFGLGGEILRDTTAAPGGPAGIFKAENAPAPAACTPAVLLP